MTQERKVWISKVGEEDGNLFVTFEQGMIDALGWKEGDVILWSEPSEDGTVILKKVQA